MKANRAIKTGTFSKAASALRKSPGFSVRPAQTKAMPRPVSVPKIGKAMKERQG